MNTETVWWLEDDLEEELEPMSGTPCGVSQSSTIGTKDQTRVQEDLLREWFQVEAELGIADAVKVEEGDSMASHMRTETSTESLLAEWYLFEKIMEAEEQFPHSAFASGPRSPAFQEGMRAAMGATGERSAGRPSYPSDMCIDLY